MTVSVTVSLKLWKNKEYTLQLLESRLYDCEKFLRELGRDDDVVREKLKELKLNPDVERKKITNVVLANNKLTEQIKDLIEENDDLKTDMHKLTQENDRLKSIVANRAQADVGPLSERHVGRKSELMDISEFDLDTSSFDTEQLVDINKLMSLRHDYPEVFIEKMMKNYTALERKLLTAHKEIRSQKRSAKSFKEKCRIHEQNLSILTQNYKKSEVRRMRLESMLKSAGGSTGASTY